jgi:hypothetical protein
VRNENGFASVWVSVNLVAGGDDLVVDHRIDRCISPVGWHGMHGNVEVAEFLKEIRMHDDDE